ncbi:MAG: Rrf2 family transcriptional regulator [Alphaproteobacteria bacterium]|nr:Rrf2 family transcriptional regulator [Alphaproteobacteria bacterium]
MVRLQKATLCALYAVLELAADPSRQVSAAEIAEKYGLSANHLAKVLQGLTRARLVESVRGVGGGYRFAGNPRRVTLYEVIRLFEDVGADVGPAADGGGTRIAGALTTVIAEIEDIAVSTLKSITLATLLRVLAGQPIPEDDDEFATGAAAD